MFFLSLLYFTSFTIIHKLPLIYISWYNLVHFNSVADFSGREKNTIIYVSNFLILFFLSFSYRQWQITCLACYSKQILGSTIL